MVSLIFGTHCLSHSVDSANIQFMRKQNFKRLKFREKPRIYSYTFEVNWAS